MLYIRGKTKSRDGLPRGPPCFPKPMPRASGQLWELAMSSSTLEASQGSGCSIKALGKLVSSSSQQICFPELKT